MAAIRRDIERAARAQVKVLILGETGVGKEVVARLIHAGSARRHRPFVAVNCSGISESLLESELFGHTRGSFTGAFRDRAGLARQADGGTLFLDELGEMSLRMQALILRFAETGEMQRVGADTPADHADVRLISATNRDLRVQIAAGEFRDDLYYRLNVVEVVIPPLRERPEDVLPLLHHYLMIASLALGSSCPRISADAERLLTEYAWPGNVRELRNVAERLALASGGWPLTPDDLPEEIRRSTSPPAPESAPVRDPHQPGTNPLPRDIADRLLGRMGTGEDFWTVVHQAFKAHELTKADLLALVDAGLRHTRGSYRALLPLFNLPATDYKRLHAFLHQQRCNLPVATYRQTRARRSA